MIRLAAHPVVLLYRDDDLAWARAVAEPAGTAMIVLEVSFRVLASTTYILLLPRSAADQVRTACNSARRARGERVLLVESAGNRVSVRRRPAVLANRARDVVWQSPLRICPSGLVRGGTYSVRTLACVASSS